MDGWEKDIFCLRYQVSYLNSLPYMHFSTSKDQSHGLGVHGELLDSPGNHGSTEMTGNEVLGVK